jgi:hypothetical protein
VMEMASLAWPPGATHGMSAARMFARGVLSEHLRVASAQVEGSVR